MDVIAVRETKRPSWAGRLRARAADSTAASTRRSASRGPSTYFSPCGSSSAAIALPPSKCANRTAEQRFFTAPCLYIATEYSEDPCATRRGFVRTAIS
jgi:hypothetical protein